MAITKDDPRTWRVEAFRDSGVTNTITVHIERLIKEDGVRIATQREDTPATAGTPVGDPTNPANYPDSDGGVPLNVNMAVATVAGLPDTIDVGPHTGITTMQALQIFEELTNIITAAEIEARRVAAVDAAVALAS